MRRKFVVGVMMVLFCFIVGCSNKYDEEIPLVKQCLENQCGFIENGYQIENIKMLSCDEDKESGLKVDTCTVVFSDSMLRHTKDYQLEFYKDYDDWQYSNFLEINEENNKTELISGPDEDMLGHMIYDSDFEVANVHFYPNEVVARPLTIDSQDTDLKKGTDTVVCSFEKITEYFTLKGNVQLDCKFNGDGWECISIKDTGKSELKLNDEITGYSKFKVSDEEIKSIIENQLYFGYADDGSRYDQSYVKSNIKNLTDPHMYYEEDGSRLIYSCNMDYHTAMAELNEDVYVTYYFSKSSGWYNSGVHTRIRKITPNDLTGTWTGKSALNYFVSNDVTLTIDSMDESGDFMGTYSVVITKDGAEKPEKKSFKVKGKFNKNKFYPGYEIDFVEDGSSDGRVIRMEMDTNTESMIIKDSGIFYKVYITKV